MKESRRLSRRNGRVDAKQICIPCCLVPIRFFVDVVVRLQVDPKHNYNNGSNTIPQPCTHAYASLCIPVALAQSVSKDLVDKRTKCRRVDMS